MIESFEDFLKNKNQTEKPIDSVQRKNNWINSINILYNNIDTWLKPFVEQSLLNIRTKDIILYEEYIGTYNSKQLDIYIGNNIISLVPKGTFILGSYGRIDMRGPRGEKLIIEPEWNNWKFVTRFQHKRELSEVSEDSFQSAIQDLING